VRVVDVESDDAYFDGIDRFGFADSGISMRPLTTIYRWQFSYVGFPFDESYIFTDTPGRSSEAIPPP
jgi:hypothetical protein